jgi:hypothetical protein
MAHEHKPGSEEHLDAPFRAPVFILGRCLLFGMCECVLFGHGLPLLQTRMLDFPRGLCLVAAGLSLLPVAFAFVFSPGESIPASRVNGATQLNGTPGLLRVRSGICGGLTAAVGTTALGAALGLGAYYCEWLLGGYEKESNQFIAVARYMVLPALGCATVGACAGWVSRAPGERYRFARSLVIVFFVSLPLWWITGLLTPSTYTVETYPGISTFDVLAVFGSPIAAAAMLTFVRVSKSRVS